MTLESAIGTYEFMSGIDGIYAFINEEFPSQEEEDVLDKSYQGLPDSPDMDNVVYQENSGKAVDTYDQFIGDEVCLSDKLIIGINSLFRIVLIHNIVHIRRVW